MPEAPKDYRYLESHEWHRREPDGTVAIGITALFFGATHFQLLQLPGLVLAGATTVMAQSANSSIDLNAVKDPAAPIPMNYPVLGCKASTITPRGINPYWDPLIPMVRHASWRKLGNDDFKKVYTVLDETVKIDVPGFGKFEASVIEEREILNGVLRQVSHNWYAYCGENGNILSVGETSAHLREDGKSIADTEGTWKAGLKNDQGEVSIVAVGVAANPKLGDKWVFDGAPGIALGGAEVMAVGLKTVNGMLTTAKTKYYKGQTVEIPLAKKIGDFKDCVQVEELSQFNDSRKANIGDPTNKVFCHGVGLIFDTSDGVLIEHNALTDDALKFQIETYKKYDKKK